jgi:hypothetical protein
MGWPVASEAQGKTQPEAKFGRSALIVAAAGGELKFEAFIALLPANS